jgi:hypothetical protein
MPATWRDPDDITPGARRTPREITGWMRYDALRRMFGDPRSGVTAQHVMAADTLRELVDLATLGYAADRPLIYVQQNAQPRFGMGPAALAQVKAARAVTRVVKLFGPLQLLMIQAIVLRNVSVRKWTEALPAGASQAVEKGKLLAILDVLVQHFAAEIDDDLARGRRLPP